MISFSSPGLGFGPQTSEEVGGSVLLDIRPDSREEAGDHDRFAHYVDKNKVTEAMVMGTPVTALCGKKWVPSRDPERFPVCPTCREIFENMPE